jgi:hypothetical protein
MPDSPDPQQTPGQVLAGSPPPQQTTPPQPAPPPPQVQDAPLNSRQGPGLSPSGFPQQQRPTPAQAVDLHHRTLGKVTSFLFGNEVDPATGQPVKQSPGLVLRSLLAGALLGASAGLKEGHGALGGLAAGGVAGMQFRDQQAQQAQAQADRRKKMSQEEQAAADEHLFHQASTAHLVAETVSFHHLQEAHDQEAIDAKNKAARIYMKTIEDAGGRPAQIPEYSARDISDAITKDSSVLFGSPGTVRHFVDLHDAGDIEYVRGKGWLDASGNPANLTMTTMVKVVDVPENLYKVPIHKTGKDINALVGYQLIPKDQEDHVYTMPLDAVSNLYTTNLKNLNQKAQADQREAAANKAKGAAAGKRGTPAQFRAVEKDKATALAKAETAYQKSDKPEKDALADLNMAKGAAQKSYEDQVKALNGSITPTAGKNAQPSTPTAGAQHKVGDSVTLRDGRTVTIKGINPDGKGFTY